MLADDKRFIFGSVDGRGPAIATLAAAIAIATCTKIPTNDLTLIITGIENQAKHLSVSSKSWVKNALYVLKARMDGDITDDDNLMSFHDSIVAVMENIGTVGDMIIHFNHPPASAFSFLCDLVTRSDIPKDNLTGVLTNLANNAQRLSLQDIDAVKTVILSLEQRLDDATAPGKTAGDNTSITGNQDNQAPNSA